MNKLIREIDNQIKQLRSIAYHSPFTSTEEKEKSINIIYKLKAQRLAVIGKEKAATLKKKRDKLAK